MCLAKVSNERKDGATRRKLSLYRALSLAFLKQHLRAGSSSQVSEQTVNLSVDSRQ